MYFKHTLGSYSICLTHHRRDANLVITSWDWKKTERRWGKKIGRKTCPHIQNYDSLRAAKVNGVKEKLIKNSESSTRGLWTKPSGEFDFQNKSNSGFHKSPHFNQVCSENWIACHRAPVIALAVVSIPRCVKTHFLSLCGMDPAHCVGAISDHISGLAHIFGRLLLSLLALPLPLVVLLFSPELKSLSNC